MTGARPSAPDTSIPSASQADASKLALTRVAIVGGGPAGLMAAEVLSTRGLQVDLYDAMPSVGRKFLLAGKGGLNLTHSEPMAPFIARYGDAQSHVEPWLAGFSPQALREWAHGLGIDTFVGSSGRIFPTDLKAAPLLRRWLQRLREAGVRFHMRHRFVGFGDAALEGRVAVLRFDAPNGAVQAEADAVILALGGASWPRLGSTGEWVPLLEARGIAVNALRPSNCGFDVAWSEHLRSRFAGQPLKSVALSFDDARGHFSQPGEFIVTEHGVEGSLVYAASARLRDAIAKDGSATPLIDLLPGRTLEQVRTEVAHPRGSRSWSSHLESRLKLKGVKIALLREVLSADEFNQADRLAATIKALPLTLRSARPVAEAISTAGGVSFEALAETLMARSVPGLFVAGEMIDWEAPTGGYLINACMASGKVAAMGAATWLNVRET